MNSGSPLDRSTIFLSGFAPKRLTLCQLDQARGDLYAISDDLEFLKVHLARIPTRKELARTALAVIFGTTLCRQKDGRAG
jgi:hypothetical protein